MKVTRRQFVKGGVAAFTVTFAAPEFFSDLARAQGARVRNLVVLYLSGGNDSLSMLIPYNDPFYYEPPADALPMPAGQVLQIGTDSSRVALGLHPRLTGPEADLRSGPPRAHSAHRLREPEPIAFPRHRHLVDGRSGQLRRASAGSDAISIRCRRRSIRWSAGTRPATLPHVLQAAHVSVPAIANPARTRSRARTPAPKRRPSARPRCASLARAGRSARAGVRLRQRAGGDGDARSRRHRSRPTRPSVTYPNTGFGQALQAVAGAMVRGDRHARLLRDDRRVRHALGAERRTRPTARTTT